MEKRSRDIFWAAGITLLTVIAVYMAYQNMLLQDERDDAIRRAETAQKQRDDIEAITKQNRSYTRCIAEVFAKFTRDQRPIENLNLDRCTTDSQTKATNETESGGTTPVEQRETEAAPQSNSPSSNRPSNPGNSNPNPPSPPDNDGVIVDLPILPPVHIPSPL